MHLFIGRGLIVAGVALVALLASCSGDGDDGGSATAATAAATAATASTAAAAPTATEAAPATGSGRGATVTVTLSEWAVAAGAESVAAGDVTFAVSNSGSVPHELVVIRTDLAADALPVSGGLVDEGQVEVADRTAQLNGGGSAELAVTVTAGSYALVCNLPGHYDLGMRIAFRVQ